MQTRTLETEGTGVDRTHTPPPSIVIKPSSGWVSLQLGEVWRYRELVYFLVWRDIKIRYKQTILGAAWALMQPLFTMVLFSLFFGSLAKLPSDGVPYPLFALTALVPWYFFANGLTLAAESLVTNSNLLTKVYFPRLIVPTSSVMAGLMDLCLGLGLLTAALLYYGVIPSVNAVWLPCLILLTISTALGVGLWLSALNVQFRDVRYTVPFLVQVWLFATPIAYPSSLLAEPWRLVYALNPMVGVVEGFRWALLGTAAPGPLMAVSAAVSGLLLVTGLIYFRRMERIFADVV